ncbi:FecCD family ABC transporter permease [Prauserella rugosa]|uniref:Iron complex transport system permease protein n=1 Tax=Prauserella rugosa TaxID=43354 RepID=A0A660C6M3_9PSEU|nr:iron ABC transporter permease [Prauserella rugosa]TWH19250.1 iron complex transport system permease protein [Prauserella rugosa]
MNATTATPEAPAGSTRAVVRRPRLVRTAWLAVLLLVLIGLSWASVAIGTRGVTAGDVLAALGGASDTWQEAAVATRIPRTVLALLVGAALAVAGAALQGVTRNPLADPGILGINSGASLAVVTGIAWFGLSSSTAYAWVALAGAGVTAVAVYTIGSLGSGGPTPLKLALAGAATMAALTSLISAVVLPRADIADAVRSWQIGGVGGATFDRMLQVLPFFAVGFLICLACARGLNMLALGDEVAAGLGERVLLARSCAALGGVVLCGAATALAGPVAFVGLVVPHLCRLLVGPDHRWLLPYSALAGAALVTAADVLGRIVARPDEIDVGIVTALLGAPFFIAVVRRQKAAAL